MRDVKNICHWYSPGITPPYQPRSCVRHQVQCRLHGPLTWRSSPGPVQLDCRTGWAVDMKVWSRSCPCPVQLDCTSCQVQDWVGYRHEGLVQVLSNWTTLHVRCKAKWAVGIHFVCKKLHLCLSKVHATGVMTFHAQDRLRKFTIDMSSTNPWVLITKEISLLVLWWDCSLKLDISRVHV